MSENSPLWSYDPIYVHTYTVKVQNHYTSSKYGHVWTQMKGLDELITCLHSRTYWHAPTPIEIRFNHLSSRSNSNENYLIHHHFIGRVPNYMWWLISRFTRTMDTCHDDASRRNLFLEDYPISASLFVFRGSNTKLFFTIYILYFRHMLWLERNTPTHLTSDTRPTNDNTSH